MFASGGVEPDDSSSRWISLSKDATLNVWNRYWHQNKSFALEGPKSITDMVCMSNCNTVAISSTDYEVTFYAIMPHAASKRFQIKGNLKKRFTSSSSGLEVFLVYFNFSKISLYSQLGLCSGKCLC